MLDHQVMRLSWWYPLNGRRDSWKGRKASVTEKGKGEFRLALFVVGGDGV